MPRTSRRGLLSQQDELDLARPARRLLLFSPQHMLSSPGLSEMLWTDESCLNEAVVAAL